MVLKADRLGVTNLAGLFDCVNLFSMMDVLKTKPANLLTLFQCFTFECWILWFLTLLVFRIVRSFSVLPGYAQFRVNSFLKVFVVGWTFLAFFFKLVFTNDMLANLTTPTKYAIDSLEKLLQDTSSSMLIDQKLYLYQALLKV